MNLLKRIQRAYQRMEYRPTVCAILYNEDQEVLIALSPSSSKSWNFPQGGIHKDESLEDAFYRELKEELGIKEADLTDVKHDIFRARQHLPPWRDKDGFRLGKEYYFSVAQYNGKRLKPKKEEISKAQWVSIDDAIEHFKLRQRKKSQILKKAALESRKYMK